MNEAELTNKIFDACVAVNPNITNQDSFWMLNAILLAIRPTCKHIDALQDALHDFLMELDDYPEWIYHEEIKTRLRAILEEGAKNENP